MGAKLGSLNRENQRMGVARRECHGERHVTLDRGIRARQPDLHRRASRRHANDIVDRAPFSRPKSKFFRYTILSLTAIIRNPLDRDETKLTFSVAGVFAVTAGRITQVWAVRNPDKLRAWLTGGPAPN